MLEIAGWFSLQRPMPKSYTSVTVTLDPTVPHVRRALGSRADTYLRVPIGSDLEPELTVTFDLVVTSGAPGTYLDPPEPGEVWVDLTYPSGLEDLFDLPEVQEAVSHLDLSDMDDDYPYDEIEERDHE